MTEEDKETHLPKPEEPVVPEESKEEIAQLTITDIAYCKQIIEIASAKGAFEAKELAIVGVTYNRISKWLEENKPPTDAEETSTAEEETKND